MEEARKDTAEMENIDTPAEETPAAAEESEELLSDGAVDNQLSQLEKSLKESEDKYARLFAEFGNFRIRSKKEQESLYSSAFSAGIAAFLPVLDNIDRAVEQNCTDEQYKEGILLIDKQLKELCKKHDVSSFGCVGETFDPVLHNAVMHVEDEALGENEICEVFQKGYKIGDKVVRVAMVKVAN